MAKRITVINRTQAEYEYKYPYTCMVISITIKGNSPARIPQNNNIRGILPLFFDDINFPFELETARTIINFYLANKDNVDEVLIHCDAGFSRSQGIAEAIYQISQGTLYRNYTYLFPNIGAKSMVLKCYREEYENR